MSPTSPSGGYRLVNRRWAYLPPRWNASGSFLQSAQKPFIEILLLETNKNLWLNKCIIIKYIKLKKWGNGDIKC